MAFEVKIPSLGESVTEAVIGHWIKQDGDQVAADEPLLELESDKANMELAAERAGVLKVLKPAGATVTAGDVVGLIESDGKAARGPVAKPDAAPRGKPEAAQEAKPETAPTPSLSPAVRRVVSEAELDPATISGTGPRGRITKADALAARDSHTAGSQSALAPPARAVASVPKRPASDEPQRGKQTGVPQAPAPSEERVPMSRLRQVIARRLVEAQQTAAILTTFNEVDMSAVQELRGRYKESFQKRHGIGLGFMSFFAKACTEALFEIPEMNAEIRGTDIVYKRYVHLGIAVGTDRGLVVPVVRHTQNLSFAEIELEIARLAGLARDNRLSPDDLAGATFTISNGGIYGSLLSTPILNPPQSGILGMHKIEKRPVVVDDAIVIRPMMYLAVSYDHRIIDGKGAVTFLIRVKERLEDPARLMLGV